MIQRILFFKSFFLLTFLQVQSQIVINQGGGTGSLTPALIGPGLTVSNMTINCDPNGYGTFSNGLATNIGINNGIILTTGLASEANAGGLGSASDAQYCAGTIGNDPQLNSLEPLADYDACILEFDIFAECSQLTIQFVFASEEYPEFVGSGYNDAFGFFVTGPNPAGGNYTNYNIAQLPNGSIVSIDNVNATTNSGYYVSNNGTSISYDAFTTVITYNLSVTPCANYHFKLAIADAGDCAYNSAVFIDFLQCTNPWVVNTSSTPANCPTNDGTATATASGGTGPFTYSWNTTPVQTTSTATGLAPGTYTCTVNDGLSCTPAQTITVTVGSTGSNPTVTVTPAAPTICAGGPGTSLTASGASTYSWSPSTGLSATTGATVTANPSVTTTYTVTGTAACGVGTADVTVTVNPLPVVTPASNSPVCTNGTLNLSVNTTAGATYAWTGPNGFSSSSQNPSIGSVTTAASGVYTVTVTANGCSASQTINVSVINCCLINNMTANISAPNCGSTSGTYDVTGQIDFTGAPASGTLTVSSSCGGSQVFNAPFTSPQSYSLTGLNADGANCNVTAVFSADAACTQTIPYTAPICPCNLDTLAVVHGCSLTAGMYDVDVHLVFSMPPTSGQLVVDVCGTIQIFNAPFTSPMDISFSVPATGGACTVSATFTADAACTNSLNFVQLNCTCPANAGLVTANLTGSGNTNYILCESDVIDITTTGYVFPDDEGVIGGFPYAPGMGFLIYSCLPTAGLDPLSDPCFQGVFNTADNMSDINDMLIINSFPGGTFTNNTVYYAPFTFYNAANLMYDANCWHVGPVTAVTYLDPITSNGVENCAAGSVTVTVSGGYPALLGGNFTGSNLSPVNATFSNSTAPDGGTITITGLLDGQMYSFDITDQNGCPHTFSGGPFNGPDIPVITPAGPFCDTDPAMNLTSTFPGGTWSGGAITNSAAGTFDPASATMGLNQVIYQAPGCATSDTIQINVNSQFNATISPAGPFCQSNPSTFLAAVDAGGTWSAPCGACINATTGEFFPSLATAGMNTITYTIPGACGDTQTTTIQVIADADATITQAGPFCVTDPALNLTAAQTGGVWSGTGITSAAIGTFTPSSANIGPNLITYSISGVCGDVDTMTITVVDLFNSTITAAGPFCENAASVILTAATPGGTWSATCGTCINSVTGQFDPSAANSGVNTVTYTISGSCGTSSTLDITVNPLPVITFTGDILSGCVPVTTTFTNTTTGTGTATWFIDGVAASNSTTTFTNNFNTAGCFDITLQVTSAAGCSNTATQPDMVCAYPYPVADFTFGPTDATVLFPAINFTNESQGASSYVWDFAGLGTSTAVNPSFTFPNTGAGSYEVCLEATSANGCIDSTCQFVLIYDEFLVYVPNTFTADGDGINDIFFPIVSGHDPLSYELMIFNRWGELIFESYSNTLGWDGTYKGMAAKQDVYVWKLKVKKQNNGELKTFYGHVTLLR